MKLAAPVVTALVLSLVGCASDEPLRGDLLVTADRIFDGRALVGGGEVLVRGSSIVAVGDLDAAAERTIELGDATILPGFVDLHVHRLGEGLLAGGVTTVRDLGAPIDVLPFPAAQPGFLRVLAAGPLVTAPGGYPIPVFGSSAALEVRGREAARRAVRRLARLEADVIKITLEPGPNDAWRLLTLAEVKAIVDEAHRNERRVTAHVTDVRGTRLALAAGVDEFAHMPCVDRIPELMRAAAGAGIEIVGTLHVEETGLGCPATLANARVFVAAGGRLLYGSDFGNAGIPPAIDVRELELLRSAGLSTADVLSAATSRAGAHLGLAPLGTLSEGAPADLVAVRGNPLAELGRLDDPLLVVAGGFVVFDRGKVDSP